MEKITFDMQTMQLMNLFENITGAKVKDCIQREKAVYLIVQENELGKAVGKHGANAKRLEYVMKRPVHIIEYSQELSQFLKNLCYPGQIREVHLEGTIASVIPQDLKSRGLIIGKNAMNLRFFEQVTARYFDISEIKVTNG